MTEIEWLSNFMDNLYVYTIIIVFIVVLCQRIGR